MKPWKCLQNECESSEIVTTFNGLTSKFIYRWVEPKLWPRIALAVAVLLFMAVYGQASEGLQIPKKEKGLQNPKGLVIPPKKTPAPETETPKVVPETPIPEVPIVEEKHEEPVVEARSIREPVQPEPINVKQLKLVVPVSASSVEKAVLPIQASCIISVSGKDSRGQTHQYAGSGTVVMSDGKTATILTCAHNLRGIIDPSISITNQTRSYSAKVLKVDDANDCALLSVTCCGMDATELADEKPKVGDSVSSIGVDAAKGTQFETRQHKITSIDRYNAPRNYETDGHQDPGRSGGGLFQDGKLIGMIQGRIGQHPTVGTVNGHSHKCPRCEHVWAHTEGGSHNCPKCGTYQNVVHQSNVAIAVSKPGTPESARPLYVSIEPIQKLLSDHVYGTIQKQSIEYIAADFYCVPCNLLSDSLGFARNAKAGSTVQKNGLTIVKRIGHQPWMTAKWKKTSTEEFPLVYAIAPNGKKKIWEGMKSFAQLEKNYRELESSSPVVVESTAPSQPVGVTLQGKAIVEQSLGLLTQYGIESGSFRWIRRDAKTTLPMGGKFTRSDILGKSGRIEIGVVTSKLPIHNIAFDYRFGPGANGKEAIFFKFAEFECEIPEDGVVGGSQSKPVGFALITAYTIISVIYDVWEVFHPTVSAEVSNDISATFKFDGTTLAVAMGDACIQLHLQWNFMFGFVKLNYFREATGLTLSAEKAILGFHKSRFYRDVTVPITP